MKIILPIFLLVLAIIFLNYSKKEYEESLETLEFVAELQDQMITRHNHWHMYDSDYTTLRPSFDDEFNIFPKMLDLVTDSINTEKAAINNDHGNEFLIQKIKLNNKIIEGQIELQNLRNSIHSRRALTNSFYSFHAMYPLIFSVKDIPNDSLELEIALLDTITFDKSMKESTINGHPVLDYNNCSIKDDLTDAYIDLNPSVRYKLNSWRVFLK
jgi:hypothetical protein